MNAYLLDVSPLCDPALFARALAMTLPSRQKRIEACPLPEEQRRLLGAGMLLHRVLGVRREEDISFNPWGKPALSGGGPCFSLSHSGDYALLAVSDAPLGADIQQVRPVSPGLLRKLARPEELAAGMEFFTLFTRKEAMMKASGLGFALPPRTFSVLEPCLYAGRLYHFSTLLQPGYVLSFAAGEPAPPELRVLEAEALPF